MPKKAKSKKKKGKKKVKQTYAYVKPRRIATAEQLNLVHNQALKNQARDNAELQRALVKEKEQQKNANSYHATFKRGEFTLDFD